MCQTKEYTVYYQQRKINVPEKAKMLIAKQIVGNQYTRKAWLKRFFGIYQIRYGEAGHDAYRSVYTFLKLAINNYFRRKNLDYLLTIQKGTGITLHKQGSYALLMKEELDRNTKDCIRSEKRHFQMSCAEDVPTKDREDARVMVEVYRNNRRTLLGAALESSKLSPGEKQKLFASQGIEFLEKS